MKLNNLLLYFFSIALITCQSPDGEQQGDDAPSPSTEKVEIVTNVMDFVLPDTLEAGWNTFTYVNKSEHPHFFLFELYPEGKNIDSARAEVVPVFQNGMNKIMEGKGEEAGDEFAKLPGWFSEIKFTGGGGIVSPGGTSITTVHLEPGYYLIECYMKMAGGIFHSAAGMLEDVVVLESDTMNNEIQVDADVKVSISSKEGIEIDDTLRAGVNTFKVYFKDQIVHENFVGHDVNIAEVTSNA
ncbi:MAG: hypothetical protein R3275_13525, partial [Saprospiraceae bacterium]|nr:hypothetical protein [Saprospiraceae bacterium]